MNELNQPVMSDDKAASETSNCLQAQINLLLVALIVLSGTFATYLWIQVRHMKQDLQGMKQSASPIFQAYNQETPAIGAWMGKLADFGRTHPDFAPIMKKYPFFFPSNAPVSTAAPASAPKT